MMSKITGVLVDDHIYDIKNDMESGYCFPNSLFPGATFKMVIDNDPANNDKVKWSCSTNADDDILAISQDGTVTFPDVDETCIGKIFVIFATDKITNKSAGIYIFIVKRFFKYSDEIYNSVKDISPWIESMGGEFPAPLDVDSGAYCIDETHIINREVNAGLYQEWGNVGHGGWKVNTTTHDDCCIYTFDKENNLYYWLENFGFGQIITHLLNAQAVAFYGESLGR
ncbi:hypothetical protein FEK42_02705 [Escherichia sp. E2748]|uniref:hypothetical protein n=3 Tax=Escherichia sp. E2748 TaxID=2044460 RepID=UPI0010FE185E|nr:hypothetical protein [Escherichia sp. E2748]TLI92513.1 hypothetical protein FEK42_02705 [Escherichia sp. E2748]